MELTECELMAASSFPGRRLPPDLSYTSRIYTSAAAATAASHGSRTRGLVAGMGTPGDGGVRGEGRQPKPSGDVGTWIGDGIPRRRRM